MIGQLLVVEMLKMRRSLVLGMTLACPLAVVALVFVVTLHQTPVEDMTGARMSQLWVAVSAMWTAFMLPLYIALATSLINGSEHRNHTWRLMLSLPVRIEELYLAKTLAAAGLMLCAHFVLLAATAVGVAALGLFGYELAGAFDLHSSRLLWAAPVAALPVLVIQHGLAWHHRSIVLPLSVAVIATFIGLQVGNSQHWPWLPWAYPLVSTNATAMETQVLAVLIAPVLGVVLLVASLQLLRRQEIV